MIEAFLSKRGKFICGRAGKGRLIIIITIALFHDGPLACTRSQPWKVDQCIFVASHWSMGSNKRHCLFLTFFVRLQLDSKIMYSAMIRVFGAKMPFVPAVFPDLKAINHHSWLTLVSFGDNQWRKADWWLRRLKQCICISLHHPVFIFGSVTSLHVVWLDARHHTLESWVAGLFFLSLLCKFLYDSVDSVLLVILVLIILECLNF